ncbi:MAG: DUF58 domain-containing protein [Kiritimatiellae bacterium]|nr:DUF58 domain-containing protein [Kiritimatiellia bacterium]
MIDTAELMKKVGRIKILTSRLVDERLTGDYHSSFKGQGVEFDEVREYNVGDDIRSIDWNVTARTGFPFVKRYCEERELTVMFLVDVSGSQAYGSGEKTKAERAAELTCLLAMTSIQNQDNIGLILFSDKILKTIPPRKGRTAVMRLVREVLAADESAGGTDIAQALQYLLQVQKRRAVVFLVSDFQAEGWEQQLAVASRKHDVICCRLVDKCEQELPNAGLLELEDPETGELIWIDTGSREIRAAFAKAAEERTKQLDSNFKRFKADSITFYTDEDPIDKVRQFFRKRTKMHHGR